MVFLEQNSEQSDCVRKHLCDTVFIKVGKIRDVLDSGNWDTVTQPEMLPKLHPKPFSNSPIRYKRYVVGRYYYYFAIICTSRCKKCPRTFPYLQSFSKCQKLSCPFTKKVSFIGNQGN